MECRMLLLSVVLQVTVDDVWYWIPDPTVGYTIRGAYRTTTGGTNSIPIVPAVSATLL